MDLADLGLAPGQGRRLDLEVEPGTLEIAGSDYSLAGEEVAPARLDLSRSATGYAMRLRFSATVSGPCFRCLGDAAITVEVDAREVHQPASGDEELLSPYVGEDVLDLDAWAHDALVLALPGQLLCREDCAGLCGVCGAPLNDADAEAHRHDEGLDPRFAKLRELLD